MLIQRHIVTSCFAGEDTEVQTLLGFHGCLSIMSHLAVWHEARATPRAAPISGSAPVTVWLVSLPVGDG